MEQRQTFNMTSDFLSDFTSTFIKLVFLIIIVYLIVLLLNFLRDKFINNETDTKRDDISDLLIILNKLFFVSGFGFIIANIFQSIFNRFFTQNNHTTMNFRSEWDYLAFGILLIFIGIGFKSANKITKSNKTNNS